MREKINILGVYFDRITMDGAVKVALRFLESGTKKRMIFTPNPEMVMEARRDKDFKRVLLKGDLIIPDGIGVVIGSKLIGSPLPERVAGYDLIQNMFAKMKDTDKTVYFLGAAPGIAEAAAEKMQKKYKGLQIVGTHDGYFSTEEEATVIKEINTLKPDLLLVGLGMSRQEKWMEQHLAELQVKVCMGVGGSFDGMSGNVKRAPELFIKLGLEWFYRLMKQPTRFIRMLQLPVFLIMVIGKGKKYGQSNSI